MTKAFPTIHSILCTDTLQTFITHNYEIGEPRNCKFLNLGLNDTYQITTTTGEYILRCYRKGWRTVPDITFELEALTHLQEERIPVSSPIENKNGLLLDSIQTPEGKRYIVLFTFASGVTFSFSKDTEKEAFLYGEMAAQIHKASDSFTSEHKRYQLDFTHLMSSPLNAIKPHLDHRMYDFKYISNLAEEVECRLHDLDINKLEYGFCHGDFHGGNAHISEDGLLTFFDFDCCGMGWRAYDLSVFRWSERLGQKDRTRWWHFFKSNKSTKWKHFLKGYQSVRTLTDADYRAIPLFVAMRQIWLVGMHSANGNVFGHTWMNDRYFDRHINFLKKWEKEFLP